MADKLFLVVLRKVLPVLFGLLATLSTITIVAAFIFNVVNGRLSHSDFFGIWSWARFEITHPAALIYDHDAQHAFLLSLDPSFRSPFAFPYPPLYLLLIRPLGWLPYPVSWAFWSGATVLAYMAAVCAPGWRLRIVLPALLAPATAVCLLYGQNGLLTAALMVGGVRLAPSRPLAGGILLGALAYKPQFAFLVVIALIAARLWRTAIAAALTAAAWVAASLLAFGLEPWTAWVRSTPDFLAIMDSRRGDLLHLMPTALANALSLGASDRVAGAIQFAASAAAAAAVWYAFRSARPAGSSSASSSEVGGSADRAAVLATASILASPYAFLYDTPLVAAAVAIVVSESWISLSAIELLALGLATLLPIGQLMDAVPPVGAVALGLLLAVILLRLRRELGASNRGAVASFGLEADPSHARPSSAD